jgi:hypothetical protein
MTFQAFQRTAEAMLSEMPEEFLEGLRGFQFL